MIAMTSELILQNIRILDFTWVLAGPYATRLLADFGAEVIKVQPLITSEDESRFARAYYNQWNRNKLGISLNLNTPEGIKLAGKLVAVSDIVIENFTPRVMANWQLDYENLRQIKSDIIMLSMSVMGETGLLHDYTGFGPTVQAFSGMTGLTSFSDGAPLGPGFSYADHVAGLYASTALLGALEYRRQTGEGQYIDISQVEAMASLLGDVVMETATGNDIKWPGNRSSAAAPHNVYRCGDDDWIAIAVYSEEEWQQLKQAMENPSWAESGKFDTLSRRLANREELDGLIEKWTRRGKAREIMALLQQNGIAAGVVQNAADLVRNPQLIARDFFVRGKPTQSGEEVADATPVKLSRTPDNYRRAAPAWGKDNDYVYHQLLGLPDEEIARLQDRGVI